MINLLPPEEVARQLTARRRRRNLFLLVLVMILTAGEIGYIVVKRSPVRTKQPSLQPAATRPEKPIITPAPTIQSTRSPVAEKPRWMEVAGTTPLKEVILDQDTPVEVLSVQPGEEYLFEADIKFRALQWERPAGLSRLKIPPGQNSLRLVRLSPGDSPRVKVWKYK